MGDLVPFDQSRRKRPPRLTDSGVLPTSAIHKQAQSAHRLRIKVQRAGKFRVEMPVVLDQLLANLPQMSEAIGHYLDDFCEDKGAADIRDQLRLVFVGGLDAARARDQAWFTDYISPGMILLCWEANP